MWVIVLLFITLAAITLWLKTPTGKGQFGEFCVNVGMKLFLDDRYHLIKNVTLPSGDGTTQIDHVIVSAYGVFVVETKNMNGGIYGSEHDKLWTQALGGKKFRFQNPLRQNYKHTQVLAEVLGVPHEKIVSIIMFIGDGELKTQDKLPANVMSNGLCRFIKSHKNVILTEEDVARVLPAIEERRMDPTLTTHRQHVQHVKGIVAQKDAPASRPAKKAPPVVTTEAAPPCPKCGKEMVRRVARKGPRAGNAFWGCSGYPACRNTMPIEA